MPVHDWTKVDSSIFHAFHQGWSIEISVRLNRELPKDHYSLITKNSNIAPLRRIDDATAYQNKKNIVVVHRASDDRIMAIIELISPGNKTTSAGVKRLIEKVTGLIHEGIHVLLVDVLPGTAHAPESLHESIWHNMQPSSVEQGNDPKKPLKAVSYECSLASGCNAYIEDFAIGDAIPTMPLFLLPEHFLNTPLEETYNSAFAAMPLRWRTVIESDTPPAASPS